MTSGESSYNHETPASSLNLVASPATEQWTADIFADWRNVTARRCEQRRNVVFAPRRITCSADRQEWKFTWYGWASWLAGFINPAAATATTT